MSRATPTGGGGTVTAQVQPGRHLGWNHRSNMAKDLLRLTDLTSEDLWRLRRLTCEFGFDAEHHHGPLRDGAVLCWFKASTKWLAETVSAASERLGGRAVVVDPVELRPRRVGSVENAARVLSSLGRAIVVGGLEDGDLVRLAAAATVPVVNGFRDEHNPCEALAELATFEARFGSLNGVRLAYLGQAGSVTHELMAAAALAGITLVVATPDGCQPSPIVTVQTRDVAQRNGGSIRLTREPTHAVRHADGIVFGPVPSSWRRLRPDLLVDASPDVVLLSCSPSAEVNGWPVGPRRLWRAQHRANRSCAYEAVLYALTNGLLEGAASAAPDIPASIPESALTPSTTSG